MSAAEMKIDSENAFEIENPWPSPIGALCLAVSDEDRVPRLTIDVSSDLDFSEIQTSFREIYLALRRKRGSSVDYEYRYFRHLPNDRTLIGGLQGECYATLLPFEATCEDHNDKLVLKYRDMDAPAEDKLVIIFQK